MSLVFQDLVGKQNYITYYYSKMCSKPQKYDYTITDGIVKTDYILRNNSSITSILLNNYLAKLMNDRELTYKTFLSNLEMIIISYPDEIIIKNLSTVNYLEHLTTIILINPTKYINRVICNLPNTVETIIIENMDIEDYKKIDNLPLTLKMLIFIHEKSFYETKFSVIQEYIIVIK
jgi:hypothetical protein